MIKLNKYKTNWRKI